MTLTPDQLAAAMYYFLATGYTPLKWRLSRDETRKQFESAFPGMMTDLPRHDDRETKNQETP